MDLGICQIMRGCACIPVVLCAVGLRSVGLELPLESILFHERWWDARGLCYKVSQRVNSVLYSFQVLYYPDCHLNPG